MAPMARAWYLAEIRYLADRNPGAAARVIEMIRMARLNLADYPDIGRQGLIPDTRHLTVGNYILTVRIHDKTLEIVAMRHGRQDDALAPDEAKASDGHRK